MKKLLLLFAFCGISVFSYAQSVRDEIERNNNVSASNYLAYPEPRGVLTPAPQGYKPFYISHYGRHGSRYLIDQTDYTHTLALFEQAQAHNALTAQGKEVLKRLTQIEAQARNRYGELTRLGAEQHQQIARRMFERFPSVFSGKAHIDARSTVVIRCILSMQNELLTLKALNPQLNITSDASFSDMHYMNALDWVQKYSKNAYFVPWRSQEVATQRVQKQADSTLIAERTNGNIKQFVREWDKKHIDAQPFISKLFTDTTLVAQNGGTKNLYLKLFKIASILQNCDNYATQSLYSFFTTNELYTLWQRNNIFWYINYGACPLNGAREPQSQSRLLKNIVATADSCIALKTNTATLRFGHETMVLPLVCLMGINGYDKQINDLNQLEQQGWVNYRVFPMAANVQLVFYRRGANDNNVIVKVLLNEQEATLPIKQTHKGFYSWSDVKQWFERAINPTK